MQETAARLIECEAVQFEAIREVPNVSDRLKPHQAFMQGRVKSLLHTDSPSSKNFARTLSDGRRLTGSPLVTTQRPVCKATLDGARLSLQVDRRCDAGAGDRQLPHLAG